MKKILQLSFGMNNVNEVNKLLKLQTVEKIFQLILVWTLWTKWTKKKNYSEIKLVKKNIAAQFWCEHCERSEQSKKTTQRSNYWQKILLLSFGGNIVNEVNKMNKPLKDQRFENTFLLFFGLNNVNEVNKTFKGLHFQL